MECYGMYDITVDKNDAVYMRQVKNLLHTHGLKYDNNVEFTAAVVDDDKIIATGSIDGKVIKCIAVDDAYRGMGISNRIITNLVNEEYRRGNCHLFIFTKPINKNYFKDMGFYEIEEVEKGVVLLENVSDGILKYSEGLKKTRKCGKTVGTVVVNCNPFTLGHRYLIEKASMECDELHVFVVSEDRSEFPFKVRFELVKQGVSDLKNVVLHEGGDYIISNATFPTYFIKSADDAVKAHTVLDIKIFGRYIVPALNISKRFVADEPFDAVTRIYNETMKDMLPEFGVDVIEIPRLKIDGEAVSASKVRKLIRCRKFEEVKKIVPETTYKFIKSDEAKNIINKIINININ